MYTIAFVVAAYLIGSLSFAVIVSKLMKLTDPRTFGSKNPGATNVLRTGNKVAALLTLIGDAAKGWFAVFLAQIFAARFGLAGPEIAMVAIAALIGHMWPIFFRFHGGKGVATALGILIAFNGWLALATFATWIAVAVISRMSSLAALLAALAAPVYAWYFLPDSPSPYFGATVVISMLLLRRHKQNMLNILMGQETRIGGSGHDKSA